jgi:hypothetical protein
MTIQIRAGKRMRNIALSAAVMIALVAPLSADVVSRYSVKGHLNGTAYSSVVTFKATGQVYQLTRYDQPQMTGLAIEYRDFLASAQIDRDGAGNLSLYRAAENAWVGVLSDYSGGSLGVEVLYDGDAPNLPNANRGKSGNLAGKYRIAGTNPDGSTYTGEAEITPWDAAFDVDRTIGDEETTGTAISFYGAFAMNLPIGADVSRAIIGVIGLFVPEGNGFIGIWTKAGSQRIGAERWVRK